ncbi:death-associated protein kinase 1 [Alosa alosa]|nr:death-associated protein kinase 1 [Alosa alosa]
MDLKEDLEAVVSRLELGHWEEVDRPHNAESSTPLISACQRGLHRIMHTLLEHAADVTLCNQSNQTAMHVCHPKLQEELLLAMFRPLPPQAQLRQACWQGNLHLLQHWLAQNKCVDVNAPNRDGLTPLMLAVRDVDLFESLDISLPWEHNPLGVVEELLTASA